MTSRHYPKSPLLGACTAIWRGDRFLLAKRVKSPNKDTWGMPGGMAEVGETLDDAAKREVLEETGLKLNRVVFNRFHEIIRRDDEDRVSMHFVLAMYIAISNEGDAVAGDDAADVRWFSMEDLQSYSLTDQTEKFILESKSFLSDLSGRR